EQGSGQSMGTAFSLFWGVFAHPVSTLTYAAASPPFGIAVALLFLFGLFWGLLINYERWMRGLRKRRTEAPPILSQAASMPFILLAICAVLAAATHALVH